MHMLPESIQVWVLHEQQIQTVYTDVYFSHDNSPKLHGSMNNLKPISMLNRN